MVRAISDNNDSAAGDEVFFTPARATEMLPLVRRIMADMVRLNESILAQREQIKEIDRLPETIDHSDYQEELGDIRASLTDDEERLAACQEELAALGVEAHHPIDGSVDFPTVINRHQVRLCWHPDDKQVEYWHETGQPTSKRNKVDPAAFGSQALN
ncbi:MAG: DUF2203 domain-containing protein [Pirellulales bacterium]|nr:DUF2203 domain-containing protein [Pirellulales bacterium]